MTTTHAARTTRIAREPNGSRPAASRQQMRPRSTELAPHVLLLIDHRDTSIVPIRRAAQLARRYAAALRVVIATPRGWPNPEIRAIRDAIGALLTFEARGVRWDLASRDSSILHVGATWRGGSDRMLRAAVVSAGVRPPRVCALAERLGVPVLVARDERSGPVVGASDLSRATFPVLAAARDLASSLERRVTYLHHVEPERIPVPAKLGAALYLGIVRRAESEARLRCGHLAVLARHEPNADAVLTTGPSALAGILEHVRERDADVLVLGYRRRSWLSRLVSRSVPERIIGCCRRSVLVVPMAESFGSA